MVKDNQFIIGVIHARGGSKRIPLKNIKPINGIPLIAYMVKAALGSKYLDRVIVSTDHPDIKKISLEYGAEVPFERPENLAEDCPSEWVTQHAVEFIEKQDNKKVDIAVSMQPTTPFTKSSDIDSCIELLFNNADFNSAFTAKHVHDRPEWMFNVADNNKASLFVEGELKGERGVIQSLSKLVIPNGGVYATRRETLFNEEVLISKNTGVHIMSFENSVDIDEPLDLHFAEFLAQGGYV